MSYETIKDELDKPLDDSVVKARQQSGRQLHYLEGYKAIEIANRIFGPCAWNQQIVEMYTISNREIRKENPDRQGWEYGVMCRMKITVHVDGPHGPIVTTREDVGVGTGQDYNSPVSAYESAAKEAATDAMKRCFRSFGNAFGNCLYNKEYLAEHFVDAPPQKQPYYKPKPAPAPAQTSTNTGEVVLATDKQKSFINRLLNERNGLSLADFTAKSLDELTKAEAGDVITRIQTHKGA